LLGLDLVQAMAGDGDDAMAESEMRLDRGQSREACKIVSQQSAACRDRSAGGRPPARAEEQPLGFGVDIARPFCEQADVSPLANGMACFRAGLEYDEAFV